MIKVDYSRFYFCYFSLYSLRYMLASLLLYSSFQYYLIINCPFTSHSRQIAFIQTERSGLLKKNVRKGKPSVKMGRKATGPTK